MISWLLEEVLPDVLNRAMVAMGIAFAPTVTVINDNITVQGANSASVTFRDNSGHTGQNWSLTGQPLQLAFSGFSVSNDALELKSTATGLGLGNGLDPAAFVHLQAPSVSGAEFLARFQTDDDLVGRLDFNNASSTDGVFIARLQGKASAQFPAMFLDSLITNDVGIGPAIVYNATLGTAPVVIRPIVAYRNNNAVKMTIAANGAITATAFNAVSSRTRKHGISNLDSASAMDALRQLTPVSFFYIDDASREQRLGFIAEDVPDRVAAADRMSVPIMEVVAVVTRVVKDQQAAIQHQQDWLDQQELRIRRYRDSIQRLNMELDGQQKELDERQLRRRQQQLLMDDLLRRITELESHPAQAE